MIKYSLTINGKPASVALDTSDPNESVPLQITGDHGTFANWLQTQMGAAGHFIGDATNPIDLDYVLKGKDAQPFKPRILVGGAIVRSYNFGLAEGSVS